MSRHLSEWAAGTALGSGVVLIAVAQNAGNAGMLFLLVVVGGALVSGGARAIASQEAKKSARQRD